MNRYSGDHQPLPGQNLKQPAKVLESGRFSGWRVCLAGWRSIEQRAVHSRRQGFPRRERGKLVLRNAESAAATAGSGQWGWDSPFIGIRSARSRPSSRRAWAGPTYPRRWMCRPSCCRTGAARRHIGRTRAKQSTYRERTGPRECVRKAAMKSLLQRRSAEGAANG